MAHSSHFSIVIDEEPVAHDISPSSDLSGSTLNESIDSEQAGVQAILLQEAEEADLDVDEHHNHLSPSVYYDDLDFEQADDEQLRLIEAAEGEELMLSKTENRAMSPSVYYEASDPPPERGQVRCCNFHPLYCMTDKAKASARSSHSSLSRSTPSSLDSPIFPTRIRLGWNIRNQQPPKVATFETLRPPNHPTGLHHPFATNMSQSVIDGPPLSPPNPSPGFVDSNISVHGSRKGERGSEVGQHIESTVLDIENDRPHNGIPDMNLPDLNISELADIHHPPADPVLDTDGSMPAPKRSHDQSLPQSNEGKVKRLRFDQDVYELPPSPEPNHSPRNTFSTDTTAVNTAINSDTGSPELSVPT